ncbi:uncharacterized protein CANTADRAFT_21373 [Suhomyces tanzawaensis NRRL Y-17324]|uniref:Uncharacterized protein n=1 Tax=Suhomyces tanzawaensis NRRL Y-17324 TaxID=984487 RepID=A0A1E4SKU1_9ASCO|nr:uncharacterized protein CANTADRAFT_21373 [Suhomyces tanzawaensis NRRL Y-17324]ODV80118.1 hypothetical protein CANTADRAFT_21373 [Suhomyces tanzawaensis NRRL Y-17324]
MLLEERLQLLKKRIICRDDEIDLLNCFISNEASILAPTTVIHGYKSIGKSFTVEGYLKELGVKHSIVKCDECITKKVLLQRCFKRIKLDSGVGSDYTNDVKFGTLGENFPSFVNALESFTRQTNYSDHHVIVLDRFDQCMEPTQELFAAFCRLQEQSNIRNISIVFIISTDDPKDIATSSIPHIYFRNYTEPQVKEILRSKQLCHFDVDSIDNNPASFEFWKQYATIIVDLYFSYTGSDMNLLINICETVWPSFTQPIRQGKYKLGDFIKVYRENSHLLHNENIINNSSIKSFKTMKEEEDLDNTNVQDLPTHSKYILIASYLASFNLPKNDLHNFSKLRAIKNKKRALSEKAKNKRGHLGKDDIDSRLLSPNFFDLERMLAILSIIYRTNSQSLNVTDDNHLLNLHDDMIKNEEIKELERSKFTLSRNTDLDSQITTLFSLGLLSKSANSDILGARVRWRCNINWSTVETLAKDTDFPLVEYLGDE